MDNNLLQKVLENQTLTLNAVQSISKEVSAIRQDQGEILNVLNLHSKILEQHSRKFEQQGHLLNTILDTFVRQDERVTTLDKAVFAL